MSDRDQATPQEEFNKKLNKREKKLRERLLEAQEEHARAQERLQRAEARLQKRLARVQRLESRLIAVQQHQTEPTTVQAASMTPPLPVAPTEQPEHANAESATPIEQSVEAQSIAAVEPEHTDSVQAVAMTPPLPVAPTEQPEHVDTEPVAPAAQPSAVSGATPEPVEAQATASVEPEQHITANNSAGATSMTATELADAAPEPVEGAFMTPPDQPAAVSPDNDHGEPASPHTDATLITALATAGVIAPIVEAEALAHPAEQEASMTASGEQPSAATPELVGAALMTPGTFADTTPVDAETPATYRDTTPTDTTADEVSGIQSDEQQQPSIEAATPILPQPVQASPVSQEQSADELIAESVETQFNAPTEQADATFNPIGVALMPPDTLADTTFVAPTELAEVSPTPTDQPVEHTDTKPIGAALMTPIALPSWAQQESQEALEQQEAQPQQPEEPASSSIPVETSFMADLPSATSDERASPPVDMDEEAGYGPSLDELFQSNERAYEPQAPDVLSALESSATSTSPITPQFTLPFQPAQFTQSAPVAEAQHATLTSVQAEASTMQATQVDEPAQSLVEEAQPVGEQNEVNAYDARAVAEATEQNTRLAASRALAIEERTQEIDAIDASEGQTAQDQERSANSTDSTRSASSEHNLVSPELSSSAKAMSISQLDEEEEDVEMLASTIVADAAAAAAAEAEAAAEASSARTREARRLAEDADLMLHQVRMAIERGVLRGEDAEAALHFTEREAARAHATLIDAEAAEAEAVRAAMNAEAEAEVAEGMSFAIEQRNAYEEHIRAQDEAMPVDGILLDELPDDDETVEIPVIHPKENQ